MRKPILPAAVIAVVLLTCTVVSAQTPQLMTNPNAGTDVVVRDVVHPLDAQQITQSTDPYTIVDGASVACCGASCRENGWWRLFNLDDDHGLTGQFCVEDIDWATQGVVGSLNITVSVYCLDDGLPFGIQFLTLQDSAIVPVTDEELTFHNTAVGGCCNTATQEMAVELFAEDCYLADCISCFIGMNDLGQTAPTYIRSESCGNVQPTDLAYIGFPDSHLIMVVNGQDGMPPDDDGGDPDVPATTSLGAVLLLLILLGSGAYFLRERAAS